MHCHMVCNWELSCNSYIAAAAGRAACLLLQLSEFQLSDWVRLDTCVTVVDASVFLDNLHSIEELRDRCGLLLLCSAVFCCYCVCAACYSGVPVFLHNLQSIKGAEGQVGPAAAVLGTGWGAVRDQS